MILATAAESPAMLVVDQQASSTQFNTNEGTVTFNVSVTNQSDVERITLLELTNSVYGDISGSCVEAFPVTLQPSESIICAFTATATPNVEDNLHVNVATAAGIDEIGNEVQGTDTVYIGFVAPAQITLQSQQSIDSQSLILVATASVLLISVMLFGWRHYTMQSS